MENKSPEIIKSEKSNTGKVIEFSRKMSVLSQDPKVKEAGTAFIRTILNLGVSGADFIPGGLGEILDVIASIAKVVKRVPGEKPDPSKLRIDLTPDVPAWLPWLSQIPEVVTGGAFPSYLVPTLVQMWHDVPRIIEGCNQAKEILKEEKGDYLANKANIDNAIETFNPKK